jgi:hypothetical protein
MTPFSIRISPAGTIEFIYHDALRPLLTAGEARRAPSAKLQPAQHAYAIPRYRVMLVKESLTHPSPVRIRNSQTAYRLLVPLFDGLDREHILIARTKPMIPYIKHACI